ncbi:MAG: SHOCT domain-containing protein [Candidatus Hydrothermarchaeales archaeon]
METGFGMGFGFLFWISALLILYYILVEREKPSRKETPALAILKQRYAAGKISQDEFLQIKTEI